MADIKQHKGVAVDDNDDDDVLLYIMVVGFHHKKGCQLEFVHPIDDDCDDETRCRRHRHRHRRRYRTRINRTQSTARVGEDASNTLGDLYKLPSRWRHLPSLALPDGSHNYTTDYVYFHLEDENEDDDDRLVAAREVENTHNSSNNVNVDTSGGEKPRPTVFGVSCYRQINASEMIIKEVGEKDH